MHDMKVVIFCGGKGTRLKEMTEFMAKPMVPVGGKPILWHLLKTYGKFGVRKFILTLGYKGETIKSYFVDYRHLLNDYTLNLKSGDIKTHSDNVDDWMISFADTGLETQTGERLMRVRQLLEGEKRFMATYGDGVADVNIRDLLDFHLQHGKIATISGGHGHTKYGLLEVGEKGRVISFAQKPRLPNYINIGFMVFEPTLFRYLKAGDAIEDALERLARDDELMMFPHEGFFHAMDTLRDYEDLNTMWNSGNTPWKVWEA